MQANIKQLGKATFSSCKISPITSNWGCMLGLHKMQHHRKPTEQTDNDAMWNPSFPQL